MLPHLFFNKNTMATKRRTFSAKFKSKVALEALSNTATLCELSSKYWVHSVVISKWKAELMKHSEALFTDKRVKDTSNAEKEQYVEDLQKTVWQLTLERDWLKKKYTQLYGEPPGEKSMYWK